MKILDSFFFNGPLGVAALVVMDNGHEVKAYAGPLARISTQAADAAYVAEYGAPVPIEAALAISGAARAAWARHNPGAPLLPRLMVDKVNALTAAADALPAPDPLDAMAVASYAAAHDAAAAAMSEVCALMRRASMDARERVHNAWAAVAEAVGQTMTNYAAIHATVAHPDAQPKDAADVAAQALRVAALRGNNAQG